MKILLILSFLPLLSFGQTDTIRLVKSYNYHPIIANQQLGPIAYWKLCDSAGIHTRENCSILSFDMGYIGKSGFTETHIIGNNIPDSICTEIGAWGVNNMVFFTNIRAILDDSYKIIQLTPMNFTPVFREE